MAKYEFSKKYEFEGTEYESIEFDLEVLSGSDIEEIQRMFMAGGNYSPVPAADSGFCAMVAARASKKPIEFFKQMPAKDYLRLTQQVSNFLLG